MKSTAIAALAVLVVAQSPAKSFNPDWAIVLPAGRWPPNMHGWCSRDAPAPSGLWTPDSAMIEPIEAALFPALQRALDDKAVRDPASRPAPEDYHRQYIGIRNGRRQIVYINGFHRRYVEMTRPQAGESWRTRVVNVCDGGIMFFGAEYDPTTRQVTNVRFNGP